MNLTDLQRKLLAAARRPASQHVPYAFEKRILARLAATPRASDWARWTRPLWAGAAACVAIALAAGAWSFAPASEPALSLAQELEQSVLASVEDDATAW
jgi:hypothetical protein